MWLVVLVGVLIDLTAKSIYVLEFKQIYEWKSFSVVSRFMAAIRYEFCGMMLNLFKVFIWNKEVVTLSMMHTI